MNKHKEHINYIRTHKPARPCTRYDLNFGGSCFNCGFDPDKVKHSPKYHFGYECEPLLPQAEKWCDLFKESKPWKHNGENFPVLLHKTEKNSIRLGSFVQQYEPHRSWSVIQTKRLSDAIADSMLSIDNDHIYIQIAIIDGRARVYAKYSQIIGTRYIADIDAATIPQEK